MCVCGIDGGVGCLCECDVSWFGDVCLCWWVHSVYSNCVLCCLLLRSVLLLPLVIVNDGAIHQAGHRCGTVMCKACCIGAYKLLVGDK